MAVSKVTSPHGLRIFCVDEDEAHAGYTNNAVYHEIFDDLRYMNLGPIIYCIIYKIKSILDDQKWMAAIYMPTCYGFQTKTIIAYIKIVLIDYIDKLD